MKIFELLFRSFRKSTHSDRSLPVKEEVSKKSESVVKKEVGYMSDDADKFSKSAKRDVPRTTFTKEEAGAVRCVKYTFYPEDIEKMYKLRGAELVDYRNKLIKEGRYTI